MEQLLTIMSILSIPYFHGVFAVLLAETLREIARRTETYLEGNLLHRFVGGRQ